MPSGHFALCRTAAVILVVFATHWAHAAQTSTKSVAAAPLVIEAFGKGTFTLNGPWQFHPGDDPAWASPAFDSSNWEQLSADQPWGKQGHAHLTGFAWYRAYRHNHPSPRRTPAVLASGAEDPRFVRNLLERLAHRA
jgi:hypothetical protein